MSFDCVWSVRKKNSVNFLKAELWETQSPISAAVIVAVSNGGVFNNTLPVICRYERRQDKAIASDHYIISLEDVMCFKRMSKTEGL